MVTGPYDKGALLARIAELELEVERLREDMAMYERWADHSPVRVIECACGSRIQVRIADHEIPEAVPVTHNYGQGVIQAWQATRGES